MTKERKLIEKYIELLKEKDKLIELAEAPQYHEIMRAKTDKKILIASLKLKIAELEKASQPDESNPDKVKSVDLEKEIIKLIETEFYKEADFNWSIPAKKIIHLFASQSNRDSLPSERIMGLLNKYTTTSLDWCRDAKIKFVIDSMDYYKIVNELSQSGQSEKTKQTDSDRIRETMSKQHENGDDI